ncbi:MAG: hypothetical protein ABIO81_09320 [Ginsengibacter sp.]
MGKEMSDSRVFGGIHYQASCDKGIEQGKKVAQNILRKVKFLSKTFTFGTCKRAVSEMWNSLFYKDADAIITP